MQVVCRSKITPPATGGRGHIPSGSWSQSCFIPYGATARRLELDALRPEVFVRRIDIRTANEEAGTVVCAHPRRVRNRLGITSRLM